MRLDDPVNPLAAEIRKEIAEAYFAACKKMVAALDALKDFDRTDPQSPPNPHQLARRSELLEDAAERVHYVLIQREAMKLSHDEQFLEDYKIPREVIACLGRWRGK